MIRKFLTEWREHGLTSAIRKVARWISAQISRVLGEKDPIGRRRRELSQTLNQRYASTIQYGPLKSMKLVNDAWWGGEDRAAMLLGLYEQELLHRINQLANSQATFIDLGAADGYYGVGVLVNNIFQKSYCFEMSEKGREIIRKTAEINRVLHRVTIRGTASKDFYQSLPQSEIDNSLLLVDIEGGEFDLLDSLVFEKFKSAVIIVEIHDWLEDAPAKIAKLLDDARNTHEVDKFFTGGRDLSSFEELRLYNDNDRWLLCSEGRPRLMYWFCFKPQESLKSPQTTNTHTT